MQRNIIWDDHGLNVLIIGVVDHSRPRAQTAAKKRRSSPRIVFPLFFILQIALEYNYGQSLFERLCKHFKYRDKNSVILLNTQYRMHPDICKFPNRYIYDNQLISDR